jgi:hypothetical protein
MNLGQMVQRVRDYISEQVDINDVNEENVYFKTEQIKRVLNEAQEIIQEKLLQYDTHFLAKEMVFDIPQGKKDLFIEDLYIVLFIKRLNSTNEQNGIEMLPYDSSQQLNNLKDYEVFGNKIIFSDIKGNRKIVVRYSKKSKELIADLDISEIPIGFHHVLVKYAASMLLGTDEAFNLAQFFDSKYKEAVVEMNNSSINRQHQEPRFINPMKDRYVSFVY